jgi:hypothetical protein
MQSAIGGGRKSKKQSKKCKVGRDAKMAGAQMAPDEERNEKTS